MVDIKIAKSAGFCFGVKRAIDMVYEQLKTGKTIYTYGPIVHNEAVVSELESMGVSVIDSYEELCQLEPDSNAGIIIRAHGVPKNVIRIIQEKGFECIDATCPFVKRIQKKAEEESKKGKLVIILGNPGHPEVEGIRGWCEGESIVLEELEDVIEFLPKLQGEICVVAQTTFNYNKFQHIVEIFGEKGYNDSIVNTICNATEERQKAAKDLAREADIMIVIGGRNSSNTRKLYEICVGECENTYFVQTLDDLRLELPNAVSLVGITAGASTPNKLIEEVQNYVRINF